MEQNNNAAVQEGEEVTTSQTSEGEEVTTSQTSEGEEVTSNTTTPEKTVEKDELTLIREKLAKTEQERDNYKNVALKRKGKLPNDDAYFGNEDDEELTIDERIRLAVLDREVEIQRQAEKDAQEKLIRENAELRLALKNRPSNSIGGSGSGETASVKDNVFSEAQLQELTVRANRIGADPEEFIKRAKQNLAQRR